MSDRAVEYSGKMADMRCWGDMGGGLSHGSPRFRVESLESQRMQ